MKRTFLALVSLLLIIPFFASAVHAADSATQVVGQQLGLPADQISNLPSDPTALKDALLQQVWTGLIEKNTYLGPVNSFLTYASPVFVILFGEPYALSPVLLAVIILWFWLAMDLSLLLNGVIPINPWLNRILAVGCCVILAQIGYLRAIVLLIGNLIYSPALWWVRIFIALGVFVGLFVVYYFTKMFEIKLKSEKNAGKKKSLEDEVKNQEEFIKGLKEGTKFDD